MNHQEFEILEQKPSQSQKSGRPSPKRLPCITVKSLAVLCDGLQPSGSVEADMVKSIHEGKIKISQEWMVNGNQDTKPVRRSTRLVKRKLNTAKPPKTNAERQKAYRKRHNAIKNENKQESTAKQPKTNADHQKAFRERQKMKKIKNKRERSSSPEHQPRIKVKAFASIRNAFNNSKNGKGKSSNYKEVYPVDIIADPTNIIQTDKDIFILGAGFHNSETVKVEVTTSNEVPSIVIVPGSAKTVEANGVKTDVSSKEATAAPVILVEEPYEEKASLMTDLDEETQNGEEESCERPETNPAHNNVTIPDNIDPSIRLLLDESDRLNNLQIRKIASPDLLTFDWDNKVENFKGKRDTFTGSVGPTQSVMDLHLVDVFLQIWDPELIDIIVRETNDYADRIIRTTSTSEHSRIKFWSPVNSQQILTFFAFLIYQGVAPLPVERDYFRATGRLSMPGLAEIMSYNTFLLINKFLQFNSEPCQNSPKNERQLHKLGKLPEYLKNKFSTFYSPGQNIVVNEGLIHRSGRLTMDQKISNKASKVGLKTYELFESSTGYLWSFTIYCGEDKTRQNDDGEDIQFRQNNEDGQVRLNDGDGQGKQTAEQKIEPDDCTANLVYQLATPLFGKGHTLVMDHFYNSPLLARCLKTEQTDALGTLRLNREFVPQSLKYLTKSDMDVGGVVYSQTHDLTVFVWRDSNLVPMISTYHPVESDSKEKYGTWQYKPKAVIDYNSFMGGVNKTFQLLSAYSMERIRTRFQVWYKKVFRRLLNISILNSHIIHGTQNKKQSHRQYRIVLAEELLTRFQTLRPSTTEVKILAMRCEKRPILLGNHFVVKGVSRHATCVWCRRNGKLSRTIHKCEQCTISLCLEPCFKQYHTLPE